jgi:hypothetical protein
MRVAPQVVLTDDQEQILRQWARGRSLPARQVERAPVGVVGGRRKTGFGNRRGDRHLFSAWQLR